MRTVYYLRKTVYELVVVEIVVVETQYRFFVNRLDVGSTHFALC